jgi:chromosome segregation ATPase
MKRKFCLLPFALLLAALAAPALDAADQPGNAEARLREILKNTMTQLRTAQNDLATAQAAQAQDDEKIKDLTAQNEQLTKQAISDKEASDKTITDLTTKNSDQAKEIAAYKDALAKWKAGYIYFAKMAKAKEDERAQLASEKIMLQRRADDLEAKNSNLFQIGNEILSRYEKFGLGQALAAKEPFVGLTRVKLENQVQGYQDKLLDQKSNPEATGTATNAATAPNQAAPAAPKTANNQSTAPAAPQSSPKQKQQQ